MKAYLVFAEDGFMLMKHDVEKIILARLSLMIHAIHVLTYPISCLQAANTPCTVSSSNSSADPGGCMTVLCAANNDNSKRE